MGDRPVITINLDLSDVSGLNALISKLQDEYPDVSAKICLKKEAIKKRMFDKK